LDVPVKILVALLALTLAPRPAFAQELSPRVDAVLKQIRAADKDLLAVSEEDGRLMRVLVAASRAKKGLEIGAASGYSAIWIGLGMRETGGRLVTIEYDKGRAQEARFRRCPGRSTSCFATPGSATTRNFSRWSSREWTRAVCFSHTM
jgi:protein-L-isoaspartate O-methyltransferase